MARNRIETATDLAQSAARFYVKMLSQPMTALSGIMALNQEIARSLAGASELEADKGDKRFKDPVWASNPGYRVLMQTYLAWQRGIDNWVDALDVPARDKLRVKLVANLFTDALAPTNTLGGNPAAMKATLEQGGNNLIAGLQNFVEDMAGNNGLPSMVDKTKFRVGENIGTTAGKVVHTEPHLELIQYQPATPEVYKTPIFIVPPQINKFYIWDLAPGRSIVEFLLSQGHQVFIVSWRNPTAEQADWDMESYVEALDRASEVACEISGSDRLNLVGACSGGITAALTIALWGARGIKRAESFSVLVAILDVAGNKDTSMGLFANLETLELARLFSRSKGVMGGSDLERAFAWLRPNDLIWAYWVNNYLLGKDPQAFDILYWNADTTNLPAALHGDMMDLLEFGGLTGGNGPTIGGHKLELGQITCDTLVLGGESDHITPWDGTYLTTNGLGGTWQYVLSQSGHIQSLINPPGNPKARYYTNSANPGTPQEFLAGAEEHQGTWWLHWAEWLAGHGGEKVAAPKTLGSKAHQPGVDAPGTYVLMAA
ncbi:alpha/beta fold hydrolase [Paracoccus sp. 11-3]|uniref:Alpha/beta fold hydrolase n=1 Tax=Paracoccus amoyensis TaxID=2760093 RepID=A0A926GHM2_9RHOB|nr:alpha/beta fold hydrolase [Paracoccus amoyensis]MBC9248432.1 alpha/beta fold hydrolase [Paracoccus amoyensis]